MTISGQRLSKVKKLCFTKDLVLADKYYKVQFHQEDTFITVLHNKFYIRHLYII